MRAHAMRSFHIESGTSHAGCAGMDTCGRMKEVESDVVSGSRAKEYQEWGGWIK